MVAQTHDPHPDTPEVAGTGGGVFSLAQASLKRSFILMGAGAILGLAIAGYSLFTAKGTVVRSVPPEDVALVNQRPVLVSDYVAQVETVFGVPFDQATKAQKQRVLNDMIREELFVQRGLELDMPSSDPDTRSALVAAVEQQVVANVTTQSPTTAQLEAYYNSHKGVYSSEGLMTVTDLLVPGGQAAAQSAVQALKAGTSVDQAIAKFGLKDTKKTNGEEFYFAAQIHLGPTLFDAARVLKTGEVSAPVADKDGVHVLVMTKNYMPVPLPFKDALPRVLTDYKKQEEQKLEAGDEAFLRGKADILIAKEYR